MRDRGDHSPFLRADRIDLDHERVGHRPDEVIVDRLLEDRGREGPELLTELDSRVDDLAHVGPPRIRHDAPVAERPGAQLHPPLEPAHHLPLGDALGRPPAQVVVGFVANGTARRPQKLPIVRQELPLDLLVREGRAPVRVVHGELARPPCDLVPHEEGRAERRPVVRRSRLDVHLVERGPLPDLPVRDAVHRTAAGQAQPSEPRALVERAQDVEGGFLEHGLQRRGDSFVAGLERLVRAARRSQ